jgi:hypothetical protein
VPLLCPPLPDAAKNPQLTERGLFLSLKSLNELPLKASELRQLGEMA